MQPAAEKELERESLGQIHTIKFLFSPLTNSDRLCKSLITASKAFLLLFWR